MKILRSRISAVMALCVAATACVFQLGCGQSEQATSESFSSVASSFPKNAATPKPGAVGGQESILLDAMMGSTVDLDININPEAGRQAIPIQGRPTDPSAVSENKGRPVVARATFELMPGEELWVIAKGYDPAAPAGEETPAGCGALMAKLPDQAKEVPVPLKHTSVVGSIDGYIATVDVTQQFQNPYNSKIEAVYVFPLPDNAAVSEFVMTVGERKIRGIIREREEAARIYNDARKQGHVASLLTQERPNIFTQKVANIEPGKQIDINIRYFNTLQYDDGAYEFVFPMVVGPRYNTPATTDGIGAVGRGNQGVSGQSTEVQYLTPGERSGHDVSLSLNINAGVNIESVRSVNHDVAVKDVTETERSVTLSASDSIPNKDFVLRYQVAGDKIKTAMMTHKDDHGQYFTMMLYPPAELKKVQRSPMEMVFVTDGYIGNDHDIMNALSDKLGDSRIFSFGVGQSPNRFLMDRMALIGRGAVAYLSLNDDPVEIMNRFNERISHPAMTDLSIDWGNMNVTDVYPQILPDLIVGRPVVITGRFTGEPSSIIVGGRQGMQPTSFAVAVDAADASKEHKGIASVWARLKIMDLMTQFSRTPDQAAELQQTVTQTALEYSLMSTFTAFVAVDSMTKTEGEFGTTVAVPVNVPEGVKYETTVEN